MIPDSLISEACARFLKRNPHLAEPKRVWGMCLQESERLLRSLRRRKVKCHLLFCWSNREPRPRLHPMPFMLSYEEWEHYVICTRDGRFVIDPTAKQFDHQHPPIRIMSLGELQSEWLYYRKVT